MSWLLDKASSFLDSADLAAADVAKDQGFTPASELNPDASASLVQSDARNKVKKRMEARRAAVKESAAVSIVSDPSTTEALTDEDLQPEPTDDLAPETAPVEEVASEEEIAGVAEHPLIEVSSPDSPPPAALPSPVLSPDISEPEPPTTTEEAPQEQSTPEAAVTAADPEPTAAEDPGPPPPPTAKLLLPPNAQPAPPPPATGSRPKPSPQSDGAIVAQLQQLQIALQEKTLEASENLEAMEEAERAGAESEAAALDLQRKAANYMERYQAVNRENEETKAELTDLRAKFEEKTADAEDVLSENQEFDARLAKSDGAHQAELVSAREEAAVELEEQRAKYEDQLKQYEDATSTIALEHAASVTQSTQMLHKLQVEASNAQLALDEQRSLVRKLQDEALTKVRGFESDLEAMSVAVVKAEGALSQKTIELDNALAVTSVDDVEFRLRSELFESQQHLAAENNKATSLEAQLSLEVEAREETTTTLQQELAGVKHTNSSLEAELAAVIASASERSHDQTKLSELLGRNQEMAASLVGKQVKIDELLSSRQAVQMRSEADKVRFGAEVEQLQRQITDLNGDGGDIEKGMLGQGGLTNRRAFRKLEQKHVPKQVANVIDQFSMVLVNILRAFPIVRLGLVVYVIVMHLSVFMIISSAHHELHGQAMHPHLKVNSALGAP